MTESQATRARRVRATRRGRLEATLGLPPRPKTQTLTGNTGWMERAACGQPEVPQTDRDAHLTVTRQADGWDIVGRYCTTCPVARLCLEDGRNAHGYGLYGGYVLEGGHLAPDRDGDPFRTAIPWTPPWEREEDVEVAEVDLVALAGPDGMTVRDAARALYLTSTPMKAQLDATRRDLADLVAAGHLRREDDGSGSTPRWHPA